jgi:hypothetical protein
MGDRGELLMYVSFLLDYSYYAEGKTLNALKADTGFLRGSGPQACALTGDTPARPRSSSNSAGRNSSVKVSILNATAYENLDKCNENRCFEDRK